MALVVGAAARAGGQVEPLDTGLVLPLHRGSWCEVAFSSGLPRRILKEPFSLAMIRPSFLKFEVVTQIVQETRTALGTRW